MITISGQPPFHVDLNRTFVRDGDLSFVYDDLTSSDNVPRTYWNLMQLGFNSNELSLKDSDNDSPGLYPNSATNATGIYSFMKGSITSYGNFKDCVDFSIGSTLAHSNYLDLVVNQSTTDDTYQLPTDNHVLERGGNDCSGGVNAGTITDPHHTGINHGRIRSEVSGVNPKYITVIAPRKNYTDNQRIIQTLNTPTGYYGTKILSKSHTNSIIECTTYSGCGTGENLTGTFSNPTCAIRSNAKFYLVTRPNNVSNNSVVDNSLVIMNGSFINVNNTPVYSCNTPGILSMNASYLNNALHVDFHATATMHPKFKISRSGVNPEAFTASLSYSTLLPPAPISSMTNPYPQIDNGNIIDRIAYDDDYFYVNYSINELADDGLLTPDCFIYCGTYYNIDAPPLLQIKGGQVQLSGDWLISENSHVKILGNSNVTLYQFNVSIDGIVDIDLSNNNMIELLGDWQINHSGIMRILGNSQVKLTPGFSFPVSGLLEITGSDNDNRCSLVSENSMIWWDGIEVFNEGHLHLKHCDIINAKALLIYVRLSVILF